MTLSVQFYTIVSMILMGVWLGVAVDTYGRFMHPNRWSILLFLSDILFWIVQSLLVFFVLLQVNEGEIRFYIFIALLCGFAMYRALFQTMYERLLTAMIRLHYRVMQFVVKMIRSFVVKPIKILIRLLLQLLTFIGTVFLAIIQFIIRTINLLFVSFARILWFFIPKSAKNFLKRLAGILKIMQNKIKNWFGRV